MKTTRIEIVDREMASVLSVKSEAERLQIAWGMWRSARRMMARTIAHENRDWTAEQVQAELSRRMANRT